MVVLECPEVESKQHFYMNGRRALFKGIF